MVEVSSNQGNINFRLICYLRDIYALVSYCWDVPKFLELECLLRRGQVELEGLGSYEAV